MDKTCILRSNLKKNILKEVIIRLDFEGVLQAEMEKILLPAKPYLRKKGFNRYEEKISNQIVENENTLKDLKSQIIYSFTAEASGYILYLSNTSVVLTVRSQSYFPFEVYADIFFNIVDFYRKSIDFFTPKRFGLRKINYCFVTSKESIGKYFNPLYYNCDVPIEGCESQTVERIDRIIGEKNSFNLRYTIEKGQIGDRSCYKVSLDSDAYMTNYEDIENLFSDRKNLSLINETIFRIFISALTDKFLEVLLGKKESNEEEISGVELNE